MSLTSWAALNAEKFLSPLGNRWQHVQQVAEQARHVERAVPRSDRDLLVAASYLHDLGYAPALASIGFHPLDGARWLRQNGPSDRLARLVAHHSCAIYEARVRGLYDELISEFQPEDSATYDALVFCDMTTGPTGERVTFEARISEIFRRYGEDHEVSRALRLSHNCLTSCHDRTIARLAKDKPQLIYGSARLSR